jgi:hypothetical protein
MCIKLALFTILYKDAGQQNVHFVQLITTVRQQSWYIVIQWTTSTLLQQHPAYIYLQFMPRSFECCIFFRDFPLKSSTNFSPCVPHPSPNIQVFSFIWSIKYLPRTSNHDAPLYAIFPDSLLLHLFFISTLFSNILSPCPSMDISDQVSHPYNVTDKITVLYTLIFIFSDSKWEDYRSKGSRYYINASN